MYGHIRVRTQSTMVLEYSVPVAPECLYFKLFLRCLYICTRVPWWYCTMVPWYCTMVHVYVPWYTVYVRTYMCMAIQYWYCNGIAVQ